jgi:SAM-dependent methyltransferase
MSARFLPDYDDRVIDSRRLVGAHAGFGSTVEGAHAELQDQTTDEYAEQQLQLNARKVLDFILPHLKANGARTVLDVGCGVGKMVTTLSEQGYESYGVDLSGLQARWRQLQMPSRSLFVVGPDELVLPFHDRSLDFAFTLGVIEHVGTTDGHADRRPDYHAVRRQWTREVFRTLSVGGCMLIAGPNRGFPIDVAHGLDSRAHPVERWLSATAGVSVHRTWGEYFLWGYRDVPRYLQGLPHEITPLSVRDYVHHSRVPRLLRPLVKAYVDHLPRGLLGTGFNPWMAVLVRRTGA